MNVFHMTVKQTELMRVIREGNADGSNVDLDQILSRLNYRTTKASLQFSLRALVAKDLIEKSGREVRRGRERQTIAVSLYGSSLFPKKTLLSALVEPEPLTEGE